MSMRRGRRSREATVVAASAFAWDRALVATLRHSTLPWEEPVPAALVSGLGARDRMSLLAQFAAHQALLQFAGIADGEVDPAEWCTIRKRGCDVRLIRIAARAVDPSAAPPALTLAQQFADAIGGVELEVLNQSWARSDAIYAEAFARLTGGAAADLRWLRASGCGEIAAPGPDGLRTLATERGRFACAHLDAVQRFTSLTIFRGVSPLSRYSAIGADPKLTVTAAAEKILAMPPGVFAVAQWEAFDEGSRQVVEIVANARHGAWLFPREGEPLPDARPFIVSPRLAARRELRVASFPDFVESPQFAAYLAHGDVPPPPALLPALVEPARSYLGALAHLGTRIPRELAARFLAEFHYQAPLEELAVEGVVTVGDELAFAGDAIRDEAARLIPEPSRAGIARLAAQHAQAVLERTQWPTAEETVAALRRAPSLSPALTIRYAHALIDCGRYRDAREVSTDEFVLARAERRTGDYHTALNRLERLEPTVLQAEILRLLQRYDEAARVLDACEPSIEAAYERAILKLDAARTVDASWIRPNHYLSSRYLTYVAISRGDYGQAAAHARDAHALATCTAERIDASLDRVFATFTAGTWTDCRAVALEALQEVEETQGDRAAGGILFTLAYLAADEAQWAHAAQRIARLKHYYAGMRDALRLEELQLLSAHLDLSRGRLADAARAAAQVFDSCSGQIKEAAALILDELDPLPQLRSTGQSGNAELTRRHERLKKWRRGDPASLDGTDRADGGRDCLSSTIPEQLFAFRTALASGDRAMAEKLAAKFDLVLDSAPGPAGLEQQVLRAAALREFPYGDADFGVPWSFSTRNRLGHWHSIGPRQVHEPNADTIDCSERELLWFEGSSRWSTEGREALAAIFRVRAENQRLKRILGQEEQARPAKPGTIDGIVGDSPALREIYALLPRVARRDVPICILGESGTGKELIARAIHRHSPRRQKTFTAVNCAALPENLVESELFGHVRGAFTGADRDRAGLIETTDGGTLFLDEIGELPLGAQAKLLRLLQEGEFRRVGDTANRTADVRIVSATNRKLESAVEEGRFRDDLYYRIRGVELPLPPLRERAGDILLLAGHFLASEHERHRGGPTSFSADVEAIFTAYSWPGNVRELQNTIRAAHAMAADAKEIDLEHLPERLRNVKPAKAAAGSYQDSVARFRRDLIERSLLQVNWNQNRAAAMLKISRQALNYQIKELGIMVGRKPQKERSQPLRL